MFLPVDDDRADSYGDKGSLLSQAIADHEDNFNLEKSIKSLIYIDNEFSAGNQPVYSPEYKKLIETSGVPLVIRCGWHDAGTQLGALCMFSSFQGPLRVTIGPCNHEGAYFVDPLHAGDGVGVGSFNMDQVQALTLKSLNTFFYSETSPIDAAQRHKIAATDTAFRAVEYYILGAGVWKVTEQWPLPDTKMQRWYFTADNQLTLMSPSFVSGSDSYKVDPTATTGRNNRWFAQSPSQAILFPDRGEEDKKLLIYETPALEQSIELTGHPVVSVYLRSSTVDAQFFVYLEVIDPDGRVRLLTEGQLRVLHRKISDKTPPYRMFGPYHSFKEEDAEQLVPGEVTEISFDLFPISVRLEKGQRIRVAIAGADADVFAPIEGCEAPLFTIERNAIYASYIDLPLINRQE